MKHYTFIEIGEPGRMDEQYIPALNKSLKEVPCPFLSAEF